MPIRLAWKTGDQIRSDRRVGNPRVDTFNEVAVERRRVWTIHRSEHLVGAVLQREVEVRRDARGLRGAVDDGVAAVHRLERADSKPHVFRPFTEGAHETRQTRAVEKVASVRPEMNTRDCDLA